MIHVAQVKKKQGFSSISVLMEILWCKKNQGGQNIYIIIFYEHEGRILIQPTQPIFGYPKFSESDQNLPKSNKWEITDLQREKVEHKYSFSLKCLFNIHYCAVLFSEFEAVILSKLRTNKRTDISVHKTAVLL